VVSDRTDEDDRGYGSSVIGRSDRPIPSSEAVSQRFSRAGRRDTAPEMAVRRELHRRGLRYLVDAPVPGLPRRRADVLFRRERVAVFVDGCFWHGCPDHGTSPRANAEWWREKIETNRRRDRDTDERLSDLGWTVVRCWEHEDPVESADRIERILVERRRRRS
jgi:DNA mismatch endonuclease (patch repair protein)